MMALTTSKNGATKVNLRKLSKKNWDTYFVIMQPLENLIKKTHFDDSLTLSVEDIRFVEDKQETQKTQEAIIQVVASWNIQKIVAFSLFTFASLYAMYKYRLLDSISSLSKIWQTL
jgi:hypothetical protein